jgi:hypothetical protein
MGTDVGLDKFDSYQVKKYRQNDKFQDQLAVIS